MLQDAGELGLQPSELWHLLPWELAQVVAGYDRRRDWAQQLGAQVAAWIVTPIARQQVSAADLMGGGPAAAARPATIDPRDFPTREDFKAAVRAARKAAA